jgi:adenosylcobinamide-phosphate synthase
MPGDAKLTLIVLMLEACVGYPRALFAAIRHPVVWIGRLIDALERTWNQPRFSEGARRALGVLAVALIVGLAASVGVAITRAGSLSEYGSVLVAIVATSGLAQRSLYEHARDVDAAWMSSGLESARAAVGKMVGRDTAKLGPSEVSAAAIESLAESFNDAVVAPTFWLFVGGLPGLLAYKALNTADSMIGHKEPRWRAFGWAAARLDDVANFVPARIAGVLLAMAGLGGAAGGLRVMWRDASKHASPNAGWPEAAAAGTLGVRLGGPATYDGVMHVRPQFGDGPAPQLADLRRALTLYKRGCLALWLLLALVVCAQVSL